MKSLFKYLLVLGLIFPGVLFAQYEDEEPLMPDVAFPAAVSNVDSNTISITWKIADRYYLYRNKFKFFSDSAAIELDEPDVPRGKVKKDEFFGEVEVFRKQVTVKLPYSRSDSSVKEFTRSADIF